MSGKQSSSSNRLARRKFLKDVGVTALVFVIADGVGGVSAWPAPQRIKGGTEDVLACFYSVSNILTGTHPIEKLVSDQAWVALSTRYDDFPRRFDRLQRAIAEEKFTDIESFQGSRIQRDEGLRRTAMDIISAWYLGKVGEVKGESQVGGPEYITFVDALLWRPTLHPGIIPSYSHGSPGWWGKLSEADLKV